ncbi:MAG: FHA domain-containing protein, partial [Planctomycetota bacterium]|nr:FHA domain-containing protein [Planctomycetota bacterium]
MSTVPILIAVDDGQSILLDRPSIVVGRSRRRADIRINEESISAVHCEISVGEDCLQIRNLGRNAVRINGRKIDDGVLLEGDLLQIVHRKFRLTMTGDPRGQNVVAASCSNDWLARLAGMELGPMPWSELSLMAQRGELTKSDEVRWSGQRAWMSAGNSAGLFDSARPKPKPAAKQVDAEPVTKDKRDDESHLPTVEDIHDHSGELLLIDEISEDTTESLAAAIAQERDSNPLVVIAELDQAEPCSPEYPAAEQQFVPDLSPLPPTSPYSPSRSGSLPGPPPFRPSVGRSDSISVRFSISILEPMFDKVPMLRRWPGIAAIVVGLAVTVFMMQPSYEGSAVSGKVTLQGRPVGNATITFTDLKLGFGASAMINDDGTFEVATLKGGMRPGTYRITVMPLKQESPEVVSELQRRFAESKNGDAEDDTLTLDGHEPGSKSASHDSA